MPTTPRLMLALPMLAALCFAPGCATKPNVVAQRFPPTADLAVEAKPTLSIEALTSEKAANDHDAAIEGWGERGWLTVARVCRWAKDLGAEGLDCPKP